MRVVEFLSDGGRKYTDPFYDRSEIEASNRTGVPLQVLRSIRKAGERSNENQVSSAGARGVYQFIPSTRNAIMNKYGVDAWNPNQASLAAAYLLKESADRNGGNYMTAIREYHGGVRRSNWGKINQDYINRTTNYINANGYDEGVQYDISQYELPQELKEILENGITDYNQVNNLLKSNPKLMPMFLNHGNQKWFEENQRLSEELNFQNSNKAQIDSINAVIDAERKQKQAEREQIMSMIPKAKMATDTKSFSKGGILDGLDPDVAAFYAELNTMFPGTVITSSLRPGSRTSSGKLSRHALGQAIDLRPSPQVHKFLYSAEGDAMLRRYNLGFLDETLEHNLKKTRGSGSHFHIGKDSTLSGNSYHGNTAMERGQSSQNSMGYNYEPMSFTQFETSPKSLPNMMEHGNQEWFEENLRAENERLKQEQIAKEQQGIQDAINQELIAKQAEREQIMSMIPKAKIATDSDTNIF